MYLIETLTGTQWLDEDCLKDLLAVAFFIGWRPKRFPFARTESDRSLGIDAALKICLENAERIMAKDLDYVHGEDAVSLGCVIDKAIELSYKLLAGELNEEMEVLAFRIRDHWRLNKLQQFRLSITHGFSVGRFAPPKYPLPRGAEPVDKVDLPFEFSENTSRYGHKEGVEK